MDFDFSNIINAITETYNQLSDWANSLSSPIGLISGIVTIIGGGGLIGFFKHRNDVKKWRRNEISKLGDIIDDEILRLIKSRKYINTMGQYEPPHDDESIYISPERFSLPDKLIDDFKSNKESIDKKRYIIMGGSGMGKSTFSAALFYKYIQSSKNEKKSCPIYIKSLGNTNVIDEIKSLGGEHSQSSILILDALDENINATQNITSFMDELDKATRNFKTVIITCRTQFFNDRDSEPNKLNINITGASKRTLSYERIYLSPFTEEEAKKYLRRKFRLWNNRKYTQSIHIAEKCWDVLSRPMVLSFIDDLMDIDNIKNISQVEIYSTIIDKWFDREIEVQPIDQHINKTQLYSFSKELSIFMYNRSSISIDKTDFDSFLQDHGFKKSPYSFKARSLLNRNNDGSIKFSHKSFWEFFIAIIVFEHPGRYYISNNINISLSKLFFDELNTLYIEGKKIDSVQFDEKRLACIYSLIQPNELLASIHEYMNLYNSISNLKNSEDFNSQIASIDLFLIQLQEKSLNLLNNITLTDIRFPKGNQDFQSVVDSFDLEEDLKDIMSFLCSMIIRIQHTLASNDYDGFIKSMDNKEKKLINDIVNDVYAFLTSGCIYRRSLYNEKTSFFSKSINSRISVFGSSDLFFTPLYKLTSERTYPNPVIILRDYECLDELVDYIHEFYPYNRDSAITINIKFKASINICFNYFLDASEKFIDKQSIKSMLTTIITTCEKDVNKYSWLK